ncbi:MAG TPA: protein kinase, partial [Vicinamibacteria bacterium]|nr:protein kinase [Vicinamibacteria bacterium]
YMSPEQAKGKRVDRRADVWAFGAVVFEMLTGHRAFQGEDVSDTLASVLAKEPVWEDLPQETPPALRQVLRLCLTKDANLRVRDMADVRLAISGAFGTSAVEHVGPNATRGARAIAAMAIAAIAGALIAALTLTWGARAPTAPTGPTTRSSVMVPRTRPVPDRMCFPCRILAISSDGMEIAYTGVNPDLPPGERDAQLQLQLRSLTTLDVRDLPGTSGATQPFFSPDGKWIAFFTGKGELAKVSLAGGNPITLVEELEGSRWGSGVWTQDGTIVFATNSSALASVSAEGGDTSVLTALDESAGESSHRFPALVPGNRAVLFTVFDSAGPHIEAVMRDSGERRVVIENGYAPKVLASRHLLFQRGESILVAPFDVDDLKVAGPSVPLVDAVRFDSASLSSIPLAQLAVSETGTLVYLPPASHLGTLGLVGRDGAFEPLGLPPGYVETPRAAPNGRSVAFIEARGMDSEVRIYDLERGGTTKLPSEGRVRFLAWNPDGRSLTIGEHGVNGGIVSRKLNSPREAQLLVPEREDVGLRDFSWSPDGARLAYTVQKGRQYDVWVTTFGESPTTQPFLDSAGGEYGSAFSPDGRWLAYASTESGRDEVYIRRYPSGERFAVSTDGGSGPVWSPDGREIYFRGAGKLFAVSVTATSGGDGLVLGAAVPLFDLRAPGPTGVIEEYESSSISGISYDILPDGKRFLMVKRAAEQGTREIVLVQNWFSELEQLAPHDN